MLRKASCWSRLRRRCQLTLSERLPTRRRKQERFPMRAFIFPGQGSQSVGMGQALSAASGAARSVFDEIDAALNQPLSRLMAEGPEELLTLTENAQPAIMANSMAVLKALEEAG